MGAAGVPSGPGVLLRFPDGTVVWIRADDRDCYQLFWRKEGDLDSLKKPVYRGNKPRHCHQPPPCDAASERACCAQAASS